MKKIIVYMLMSAGLLCTSSCTDWLDVRPNNEQATADFWKTKEDVESVLSSAYAALRNTTQLMIDWGELRAGSLYDTRNASRQKLQEFRIQASDNLCQWSSLYNVIGLANSVIKYAPEVQQNDNTYLEVAMNANLAEAYFLRDLCYFYLVRNFRDVPLVTEPYVDDSHPYIIAKSTETEVIAQIKKDIETALATGSAKEFYDDEAEGWAASKGRGTKWALYALMADVCLWNGDYDQCVEYADKLINSDSMRRPVFMSDKVNSPWVSIFYPGNSNESIFEINWDQSKFPQTTSNSPSMYFAGNSNDEYMYTDAMCNDLYNESIENGTADPEAASLRAEWGAYVNTNPGGSVDEKSYAVWKYITTGYKDANQKRSTSTDVANFIVYRMTDVLLMKAEALIWKGSENFQAAMDIINQVRERSNLQPLTLSTDYTEVDMLKLLLNERNIEFAAEGKRWYDLVRFGKSKNFKYKADFIDLVMTYNTSTPSWLRSVLNDEDAWYLPISQKELNVNSLLEQNPYYVTGSTD